MKAAMRNLPGTAVMAFLSLLAALAYSVATFVTVTVSLCGHADRAGDGKGRGCTGGVKLNRHGRGIGEDTNRQREEGP